MRWRLLIPHLRPRLEMPRGPLHRAIGVRFYFGGVEWFGRLWGVLWMHHDRAPRTLIVVIPTPDYLQNCAVLAWIATKGAKAQEDPAS